MRALPAVLVVLFTSCSRPAVQPPISPDARARVVVLISATAEWKLVVAQLPGAGMHDTPFGSWFVHRFGSEDVVMFHGGYGKISAAGSTQYAIDRWHPDLLVNLGTCGGFGGERAVGDVVLASETYVYDVIELMGDPDEAIEDFHTKLDPALWPPRLADRVIVGTLVSADRDIDPAAPAQLRAKYHASAGDWESGAIAWVAAHNHTRVIILRGVTDLVDAAGGDPTYNAVEVWQRASRTAMATLLSLLGEALPDLAR